MIFDIYDDVLYKEMHSLNHHIHNYQEKKSSYPDLEI